MSHGTPIGQECSMGPSMDLVNGTGSCEDHVLYKLNEKWTYIYRLFCTAIGYETLYEIEYTWTWWNPYHKNCLCQIIFYILMKNQWDSQWESHRMSHRSPLETKGTFKGTFYGISYGISYGKRFNCQPGFPIGIPIGFFPIGFPIGLFE